MPRGVYDRSKSKAKKTGEAAHPPATPHKTAPKASRKTGTRGSAKTAAARAPQVRQARSAGNEGLAQGFGQLQSYLTCLVQARSMIPTTHSALETAIDNTVNHLESLRIAIAPMPESEQASMQHPQAPSQGVSAQPVPFNPPQAYTPVGQGHA